jgi:hypothetical protein
VTELTTKIILVLNGNLPMSIRDIAEKVRGKERVNVRNCAQKCKYQMENLEADEIIESFTDGKRTLYKLKEGIEILDGKMILGDGKYTEDVHNVLRMINEDGETILSILQ